MMQPLKRAIRDHYARERLDASQLARLQALATPIESPRRPTRRNVLTAVTMALLFGLTAVLLLNVFNELGVSPAQRVADEIALNHFQHKPLDVNGGDIATLRPALDRLDFALLNSPRLRERDWTLQGGRYCSVQTVPAAQLRYRTVDSDYMTVYQAPYDPQRHGPLPHAARGEPPLRLSARGVAVELWVEQGLLLAIARAGVDG